MQIRRVQNVRMPDGIDKWFLFLNNSSYASFVRKRNLEVSPIKRWNQTTIKGNSQTKILRFKVKDTPQS